MMAKENLALQATYFSEPLGNKTYFTCGITFAEYDLGQIRGRWGMNRFLGHSLGRSGYYRLDDGKSTELTLDMIFHKCILRADDHNYNRLYGELVNSVTGESQPIVFNKAKDEIVSG